MGVVDLIHDGQRVPHWEPMPNVYIPVEYTIRSEREAVLLAKLMFPERFPVVFAESEHGT